jgi:hypothetical protein
MHFIPTDKYAHLIVIGDSDMIIKGLQRLIKNLHPSLMQIYQ